MTLNPLPAVVVQADLPTLTHRPTCSGSPHCAAVSTTEKHFGVEKTLRLYNDISIRLESQCVGGYPWNGVKEPLTIRLAASVSATFVQALLEDLELFGEKNALVPNIIRLGR